MYIPNPTASKPKSTLIRVYKRKTPMFPDLRSSIHSRLKVENVVSPPQKPVAKKRVCGEDSAPCFNAVPIINPMRRQPSRLAMSVG